MSQRVRKEDPVGACRAAGAARPRPTAPSRRAEDEDENDEDEEEESEDEQQQQQQQTKGTPSEPQAIAKLALDCVVLRDSAPKARRRRRRPRPQPSAGHEASESRDDDDEEEVEEVEENDGKEVERYGGDSGGDVRICAVKKPSQCVLATIRTPAAGTETTATRRRRKPIDLVAVVDTSGSVAGDAERLLQDSLRFLVQQLCADGNDADLQEGDRLAIVSFSDNACVQLPLTRMDARGKADANAIIAKLRAYGGTNLSGGVFRGLDLVESRAHARPVSSVLVLTDGLANRGVLDANRITFGVKSALRRIAAPTSLFTFGVGSSHDADTLVEMARASAGGVYAYLGGPEEIPRTLEMCLGGLFSVVAQNVRLHYDPLLWAPLPPWQAQRPGLLSIGDMYMAEEKHLVLVRRVDAPRRSKTRDDVVEAAGDAFRIEYLDVASMTPQTVQTRGRAPASPAQANEAIMHVASFCNLALALQAMNQAAAASVAPISAAAGGGSPRAAGPALLDASLAAIRSSPAFCSGDPVSGSLVDQLESLLTHSSQDKRGHRHALLSLSNQYEAQRVLTTSLCSTGTGRSAASGSWRRRQGHTLPIASAVDSQEVATALEAVSSLTCAPAIVSRAARSGPPPAFALDRSSRTALPLMADLGLEYPVAREVDQASTRSAPAAPSSGEDRSALASFASVDSDGSSSSSSSSSSTASSASFSGAASRLFRRASRRQTSPSVASAPSPSTSRRRRRSNSSDTAGTIAASTASTASTASSSAAGALAGPSLRNFLSFFRR